jgi:hypothetical protein
MAVLLFDCASFEGTREREKDGKGMLITNKVKLTNPAREYLENDNLIDFLIRNTFSSIYFIKSFIFANKKLKRE